MKIKIIILLSALTLASALWAASSSAPPVSPSAQIQSPAGEAIQSEQQSAAMRLDGERRFRANCGRCHAAPHKFPPQMMATIVRHMRVRATITDQDMRLILHYMTE